MNLFKFYLKALRDYMAMLHTKVASYNNFKKKNLKAFQLKEGRKIIKIYRILKKQGFNICLKGEEGKLDSFKDK